MNCDKDHGPNKRSQGMINVLNTIVFVPSNVQFSHQEALLYVFPTIDMFPGPTELRLIGYSIESIWTQKSKSNTSTPKTYLPTF